MAYAPDLIENNKSCIEVIVYFELDRNRNTSRCRKDRGKMITAILLRNIKNYRNINFIPICDSRYMYSIFVGNNGVGKSAVLEAIDV